MRTWAGHWLWVGLPLLAALAFGLTPRPREIQPVLQQAEFHIRMQQHGQAARRLETAAAWEPWNGALLERIGMEKARAGLWGEAAEALERADRAGSLSLSGRRTLAQAWFQGGKEAQAVRAWKEMLAEGQADEPALRSLAGWQEQQHDWDGLETTLRAWSALQPGDPAPAYRLGLVVSLKSLAEARTILEEVRQGTDQALAAQAARLQKKLESLPAAQPEAYRLVVVGRELGALDEWPLAQDAFQLALRAQPDYAEAWAFLGEAKEQQGGDGSAELQRALHLDPASVSARALLAEHWRRRGSLPVALAMFYTLEDLEPRRALWQAEIGWLLGEMGDINDGLKRLQRGTQLEAGSAETWARLAEFCLVHEIELRTLGLPAARQALLLNADSSPARDRLARTLFALEDVEGASRIWHALIRQDGVYAPAYLHLGEAFFAENRRAEAFTYLSLAAQMDKEDSLTAQAARRLLERFFQ